jgi:hypothetical protein
MDARAPPAIAIAFGHRGEWFLGKPCAGQRGLTALPHPMHIFGAFDTGEILQYSNERT